MRNSRSARMMESPGSVRSIHAFPGALIFPIACGVSMPMLYCRAALGERLQEASPPVYPAGTHYLGAGRCLAGVFAELREP
jgi:hypothetical protein